MAASSTPLTFVLPHTASERASDPSAYLGVLSLEESVETLGKYRLLRRVAVGGMAEIFLAEQPGPSGFSRRVAIKRILPHRADDAEFVEMFLNEARLAAMLNHPNIVQIYDLGQIGQTYFIAMEFVEGYDLGQILDQIESKGEKTPPLYAAHIIGQAAAGLHYAHQYLDPQTNTPLGLIHRDISLPNIMVSNEGIAKVLDFGIAKARISGEEARKQTQTGVLKGKISYMSPEYLMGDPIDWRHDIFALGVVFYELVTGQKPFKARGDVQMLQAILTQEPTNPREYHSSIPAPLIPIMMRLLAKEPNQRFQHGAELEHAIDQCILACTGGEISQFYLSEFLRTLFSDAPTHAPEPTRSIPPSALSPQRAASTSNAPAFRTASPTGDAPAFRTASPTGDFTPFPDPQSTPKSSASSPNHRNNPWVEETRSIDISQLNASKISQLGNSKGLLHLPEPTPTAALVLRPDQNLKSMSLEEIAALQPGPKAPLTPVPVDPKEPTPPHAIPAIPPPKELPTWIYIVLPFLIVLLIGLVFILWRLRAQRTVPPTPPPIHTQAPDAGTTPSPSIPTRRIHPPAQPVRHTPPIAPPPKSPDAGTTAPITQPDITPDITPSSDPQIEIGEASPIPESDPSPPETTPPTGNASLLLSASRPCPCKLYVREQAYTISSKPNPIPLDEGTHNLILRRSKPHIHLPFRIQIKKGETLRKHIQIREGYLSVTVTPWSSKVFLNKDYIGTTPLRPIRLYQGVHQLRIDNIEHLNRPITKTIFIRPNTQLPIRIRIR